MSAILQTGIGLGQASASPHQNVKGTVPSSTLPAASSEHSSQLAFQIAQLLPMLARRRRASAKRTPKSPSVIPLAASSLAHPAAAAREASRTRDAASYTRAGTS